MRKVKKTFEGGCSGIVGEVTESCLYNVYCDESCHLDRDGIPVMVLGVATCLEQEVRDVEVSVCVGIYRSQKMSENARCPILNPPPGFLNAPKPGRTTSGGKAKRNIKDERLNTQRKVLSSDFQLMADAVHLQPSFNGHVVLYADMFEDSHAPSYTPNSIFNPDVGALITLPYQGGYLFQVHADRLRHIAKKIESTSKTSEKVDISRVQGVRFFGKQDVMGKRSIEDLWLSASEVENGRAFTVCLMRLGTQNAVAGLIDMFNNLRKDLVVVSPQPLSDESRAREARDLPAGVPEGLLSEARNGDRVALALIRYLHRRHARSTMLVPSIDKLEQLVASGSVFRIGPVTPIAASVCGGGDRAVESFAIP